MKHIFLIICFSALSFQILIAQNEIKLWPNGAPGNNECPKPEERFNGGMVRYVSEATISLYLPEKSKNTGAAIIICAGGGYGMEAITYEGYDYAEFLQHNGIAGIVIKYRLPYGHSEIPLLDVQHAIRTARYNAEAWGIDPKKIGVSGFSAGGHLASTAATHFDNGDSNAKDPINKLSCRPDFAVLVYAVISFNEQWGHVGSGENLMGKNKTPELMAYFSNEQHVTAETPTAFLVLADDDKGVVPQNSIEFYSALKAKGVPAELHIFKDGGHGFGMNKKGKPHDQWPNLLVEWMKASKLVNAPVVIK
jgi:acetyl esterase/lipase